MANKPEFVDMISEATRQSRRRASAVAVEPVAVKERSRMGHWPSNRMEQWRLENLTPWKMKSWKFKNWD